MSARASARKRAFAWSSASRSIIPASPSRSATRPAAARIPTCRIPPPRSFRARRALQMKSFEPTSTLPTGQARPFERQNVTESAGPASSRGSSSSATTAFQNRAPSMWSGTPPSCATAARSPHVPRRRRAGCSRGRSRSRTPRGPVIGSWTSVGSRNASRTCVEIERPVRLLLDRPHGRPDDDRVARGLVQDDVAVGAGDHLLAALDVGHLGHEVAHRARGDEQAGLLAEQLRGALLERDHGRVVAEDVVADLGLGHGPAHLGRGLGDGVGAQVDEGIGPRG